MHIVIADDEVFILEVLCDFVADLGHTASGAQDGLIALEFLRTGRVDLLVTDLRMPRMNGAQLVQAVALEWPDLPVIIITGFASEAKTRAVEQSGARLLGKLFKPFEFSALAALIAAAAPVPSA